MTGNGPVPKRQKQNRQAVAEKTLIAILLATEWFDAGHLYLVSDWLARQVDVTYRRKHRGADEKKLALSTAIRGVDGAALQIPLWSIKLDALVRWLGLTPEERKSVGHSRVLIRDPASIRAWAVKNGEYLDDAWIAWPKRPKDRHLTLTPEGAARLSEPALEDGETPASRALLLVEGLPYLYRQAGGADKFWLRLRAQLNGGAP